MRRPFVVEAMQKHHLTTAQFDQLSIEEFGGIWKSGCELFGRPRSIKLAAAAGYFSHAAVALLRSFSFLSRDSKPARAQMPSMKSAFQQAKDEIKQTGGKRCQRKALQCPSHTSDVRSCP